MEELAVTSDALPLANNTEYGTLATRVSQPMQEPSDTT